MVDLATMGKFSKAVGVGGGGAPPHRQEKVTPFIQVLGVEIKKAPINEIKNIKVRLLSKDGGNLC